MGKEGGGATYGVSGPVDVCVGPVMMCVRVWRWRRRHKALPVGAPGAEERGPPVLSPPTPTPHPYPPTCVGLILGGMWDPLRFPKELPNTQGSVGTSGKNTPQTESYTYSNRQITIYIYDTVKKDHDVYIPYCTDRTLYLQYRRNIIQYRWITIYISLTVPKEHYTYCTDRTRYIGSSTVRTLYIEYR